MPDQESTALANPPVAPQPQPTEVPSLYDGLRVRMLDPTAGAIPDAITVGKNLVSQVKDIAADPAKRREFVHGTLVGMASGTEEGEVPDIPEIYKGLRVRKADEVMVQPQATSRATPTGESGTLPPEIHAHLEKQAGRELTHDEAVSLDRANLERGMVTAPQGDTGAIREAKRSELEQPRKTGLQVTNNASEWSAPYANKMKPADETAFIQKAADWLTKEHPDSAKLVKGIELNDSVGGAGSMADAAYSPSSKTIKVGKGWVGNNIEVSGEEKTLTRLKSKLAHELVHAEQDASGELAKHPAGSAELEGPAIQRENETRRAIKNNASGESSASQEGINRLAAEKLGGVKRFKIDTRSKVETPLTTVDAVDAKVGPYDVTITRDASGKETLLDKGEKARYTPKKKE